MSEYEENEEDPESIESTESIEKLSFAENRILNVVLNLEKMVKEIKNDLKKENE